MSSAGVALMVCTVLLASLTPAFAAPWDPIVTGIVYGSDSAPIPGATIAVNELRSGTYRLVATLTADAAGAWSFTGKPATYRFDFSAPDADPESRTLVMVKDGVYTLDVVLQLHATGTGSISGVVVYGALRTPIPGAYVFLYRQNDDGTWPATSPGWGEATAIVKTGADGSYTSGPIALGSWKVRFFDIHRGSQWWQYVYTVDLATIVTLSSNGQALTGIEGWYSMP
jgi:hypothetical protein